MSYDIIFNQAMKLHEEGKLNEAESLYRQILTTNPNNPDLLNLLGLIAFEKGIYQNSAELHNKACLISPKFPAYQFNLALALNAWGKKYEAINAYKKVIELDSSIKDAHNNIANIYLTMNNNEKAIYHLQEAIAIDDNFIEAKVNLASITNNKEEIEKILQQNPNNAYPYFILAKFNQETNIDLAISYCEKAYHIEKNESDIVILLAELYYSNGENIKAKNLLEENKEILKRNCSANLILGNIYLEEENLEKAEKYYIKAKNIDANNFDVRSNYGNLLCMLNQKANALEEYRKAILINPKSAKVIYNIAKLVTETKEYDEALGLLFTAIEIDNDFLIAKELIYKIIQSINETDHDKAIKILENWQKTYTNCEYNSKLKL